MSFIAGAIALIGEIIVILLKAAGIAIAVGIALIITAVLVFRAKILPSVRRFLNRNNPPAAQDAFIVDVIPNAPLQEHGFTPEERAKIASEAILEVLANKNPDETPRDAVTRLTEIAQGTSDKREQPELVRIRRITLDLFAIFKNDPARLNYTHKQLSQCISGLNEVANKSFAAVTGVLYAAEEIKKYVGKLSTLASLSAAAKSEALSLSVDGFIERSEKLYWLFLAYPNEGVKHGRLVDDMLSSITDKLQIHAKMREYGVAGADGDAKNLIEKTETTLKEMNIALDTVLKNILERDLLKADSELDALRQDLRLRGLY
ncbi:MAG: hypothetical protein LBD73_02330 [Deferribacteraceae bacterium]|nr:hypothetical protein [Deferribacteraceae bacterium]